MSRRKKLLCRSILDAEIGVAPPYQTRTRDSVNICPTILPSTMPMSSYVSHHLHPKREKRPFKFSTEQNGQTIKHSNPRWGITPTAKDAVILKQWSMCSVNASTTPNSFGFNLERSLPDTWTRIHRTMSQDKSTVSLTWFIMSPTQPCYSIYETSYHETHFSC
jgi:hypothetical protein